MVEDCEGVESDETDVSKWIMRFEIDKETMLDKNITMDDVEKQWMVLTSLLFESTVNENNVFMNDGSAP